MSEDVESAITSSPTSDTPAAATGARTPRWLLALAAVMIAIVAGFAGSALTYVAFQPADGRIGPQGEVGPEGPPGASGPQGPPGAPAKNGTPVGQLGVCFEYTTQYNDVMSWVDSVSVFSPTRRTGVVSCDYGTFVPVAPVSGY